MNQDENTKPPTNSPPSQHRKQRLFFSTTTLSRFMRVCYGKDAPQEVQRRIAAYIQKADFELAEIWKRVLAHLHGVEIKEDARRIVKAPKPFKVRT